jgi:hypothetical protein
MDFKRQDNNNNAMERTFDVFLLKSTRGKCTIPHRESLFDGDFYDRDEVGIHSFVK